MGTLRVRRCLLKKQVSASAGVAVSFVLASYRGVLCAFEKLQGACIYPSIVWAWTSAMAALELKGIPGLPTTLFLVSALSAVAYRCGYS